MTSPVARAAVRIPLGAGPQTVFDLAEAGLLVLGSTPGGLAVDEANLAAAGLLRQSAAALRGQLLTSVLPVGVRLMVAAASARVVTGQVASWSVLVNLPGTGLTRMVLAVLERGDTRDLFLAELAGVPGARETGPTTRELGGAVVAETLFEGILLATTETSIIATDVEGRIMFVNRGAEKMLGYAADELIGQTPARFHDLDEVEERAGAAPLSDVSDVVSALESVIGGAPPDGRRDWTYHRKDGSRLTVSLGVTVIRDHAGTTLGYLGIAEDVTECRQGERLLEEARVEQAESRRRLTAVTRAKEQFIATVSHELRTPMTCMLGFTELLQSGDGGPLSDQQSRLLSRVESNAIRLGDLVEELITLARVQSEAFWVPDDEVPVNPVVRDALATVESSLADRDLQIELDLDPAEPVVSGAAEELGLALSHLIANAVKFTPDGGRITVSTLQSGTECLLTVADTGSGVPVAEQPDVFDAFFRTAEAHAHAIQGFGVGLSIVRAIARAHGGDVSVSPEGNQGAVFVVRLPMSPRPVGRPGGSRHRIVRSPEAALR